MIGIEIAGMDYHLWNCYRAAYNPGWNTLGKSGGLWQRAWAWSMRHCAQNWRKLEYSFANR